MSTGRPGRTTWSQSSAGCGWTTGSCPETLETISSKIKGVLKANNADTEVKVCKAEETTYTGVKFKGQKYMPAFTISSDHPLVKTVAGAAEAILSHPPKIQRWDFATDGGYSMVSSVYPRWASHLEEKLTHAPNEYVRIDYIVKAAKVYAEIILRICGFE